MRVLNTENVRRGVESLSTKVRRSTSLVLGTLVGTEKRKCSV